MTVGVFVRVHGLGRSLSVRSGGAPWYKWRRHAVVETEAFLYLFIFFCFPVLVFFLLLTEYILFLSFSVSRGTGLRGGNYARVSTSGAEIFSNNYRDLETDIIGLRPPFFLRLVRLLLGLLFFLF